MNIPSSLGRYFDYSKPVPTLKADAAKDRHVAGYSNGGRLGKILKDKRFVEVEPSAPTRYNSINNTGSTIDRILINTAPCFVRQSQWASVILDDPKRFFSSGLSDHGMVQCKATFTTLQKPGEGIPPIA